MNKVLPSLEQARAVVEFWEEIGREAWFAKDEKLDTRFRETFHSLHFAAAAGHCAHWLAEARPALGLILLLDQYPRNSYRGTGHMFATDGLARHYARQVIDRGLVDALAPALRLFICLPFIHSENMADQDYALELYARHAPDSMKWAKQHRDIVHRFGRFPHRNASLGRATSPQEQAFLDGGGFAG